MNNTIRMASVHDSSLTAKWISGWARHCSQPSWSACRCLECTPSPRAVHGPSACSLTQWCCCPSTCTCTCQEEQPLTRQHPTHCLSEAKQWISTQTALPPVECLQCSVLTIHKQAWQITDTTVAKHTQNQRHTIYKFWSDRCAPALSCSIVAHLCLGRRDLELNETDLGLLLSSVGTSLMCQTLCEDKSINELRVF